MPHIIRLRGPWRCQPLWQWEQAPDGSRRVSSQEPPPGGTFPAPGNWRELLGDDFRGFVRLVRTFHRPTGLDDRSRVWLAYCDWPSETTVVFNGCPFAENATSGRLEITRLLTTHNELAMTAMLDAQSVLVLMGQVQLEIE